MADDRFLQYARNYRWGTCAECPRDKDGHAYPEFCRNTTRGDYTLTAQGLIRVHALEVEEVGARG